MDAGSAALAGALASSVVSLAVSLVTAKYKSKDAKTAAEPQWFGSVLAGWEKELTRLHARVEELEQDNDRLRHECEALKSEVAALKRSRPL